MIIKKLSLILLLIIVLANISYANIMFNKDPKIDKYIKGTLFLTTEYIVVPLYMKHIWWSQGFDLQNPLYKIDEREPYHVDESWHAVMNFLMQEVHYYIMKNYFNVTSPIPSMSLTAFTWLMVEIFDSIEKEDKYGFSINDEIGNLVGLFNWYLHYKFPWWKLYIRGGIRQWDKALNYVKDSPKFFTNTNEYYKEYGERKYEISKVEYIYKFYKNFYSGIALSKAVDSQEDVFGFTFGWDFFSEYFTKNTLKNKLIRLIDNSFSFNFSFTIWTDKNLTFF